MVTIRETVTVQIGSFPSTYSAACFTYAAGIHADAVSYFTNSGNHDDQTLYKRS